MWYSFKVRRKRVIILLPLHCWNHNAEKKNSRKSLQNNHLKFFSFFLWQQMSACSSVIKKLIALYNTEIYINMPYTFILWQFYKPDNSNFSCSCGKKTANQKTKWTKLQNSPTEGFSCPLNLFSFNLFLIKIFTAR